MDYQQKIPQVEEEISRITCWRDADNIWAKFQQVADSDSSSSTQAMWKWKKELFPKIKPSPPMGMKNIEGEVKTKWHDMQDIYQREYRHRMRARPLLPEMQDIESIQDQLFNKRLESARRITTPPWTSRELDKVLSMLKSGKARDPSGLNCDIFKKNVCGTDLKQSLLILLNKTK